MKIFFSLEISKINRDSSNFGIDYQLESWGHLSWGKFGFQRGEANRLPEF
jgi:hypothetical protein